MTTADKWCVAFVGLVALVCLALAWRILGTH